MVNTLVTHKKHKGICCVSKELTNHYIINVGLRDTKKVSKSSVKVVDTSNCKTITFTDFRVMSMTNKVDTNVIVGNELKQYVGIGWVTVRLVTYDDLKKYPRVV